MRIEESQYKAFLLDSGLVTREQLSNAQKQAEETGKSLRDALVAMGYIAEDQLRRLEAYILGIPFVDLSQETVDPEVLQMIPEPIARKHNIIAFKKTPAGLEVAMLDPDDIQTIEFIRKKENARILPRLTTPESIRHVLLQYQKSLEAEFSDIIIRESAGLAVKQNGARPQAADAGELKKLSEDLPIIRIVDTLIRHAILQSSSDIHVEPAEKEVIVRYRIDGILRDAMVLPAEVSPGIVARIKVMANLKLDERRLPQDGRFQVENGEQKISVRVSVMPVFDGEKIVLRLLPEGAKGFGLEELGFTESAVERVHRAMRRPTGIILATGPTGSGKTTTLYAMLEILNVPGVNVATVEDPIEYRIPRVNQTQVRPDIGLTFANGLRSLLRQDPNIIMVGEIRDTETASLAINAALTGHLVLSTLHTNSAAGALPRLLDMKVEPFLIASTVSAIISQRLVRRLCSDTETYRLPAPQIARFRREIDFDRIVEKLKAAQVIPKDTDAENIEWGKPAGSEACPDGYKGRIGIHEVLEMSETIRELVLKNASTDQIEKQARAEGMATMLEEGFIRAAQKITSIEEVLRVTTE